MVRLTQINRWPRLTLLTCDPDLAPWSKPCPELGFKIMIIIVFILTCLNWTILELRVFYMDVLGLIFFFKKNYFWRYFSFIHHVLKIQKFILKLSKGIFLYFYFYLFNQSCFCPLSLFVLSQNYNLMLP